MKTKQELLEHGADAGYAAYCDHTVLRAYTPSGGVGTREMACDMLMAGADRLGVSKVPQIVGDDTSIISASKRNQPPKF